MAEAKKDAIKCPECGGALNEVYAEATYGRVILLDQCAVCGGVWFDRWELYFVKGASLKSLDTVDVKSLLADNTLRKGTERCPRCDETLILFKDPMLPKDALIERCEKCSGLWLNRGELTRYANHKESSFGNTAGATRTQGELNVLRNLQKELDTATIAPTSTLKELELSSAIEEGSVETKEVAKDIGFLILQSLVRLVFKI
ncbi:MAG: zf-TFIIB domain-containing protein [Deltaproteobacteria bacterium]|nr:zf-TFIIB domain-containing protein [Deltaproteobacteria bacterium]